MRLRLSMGVLDVLAPPCMRCSAPTERGLNRDAAWYCCNAACLFYRSRDANLMPWVIRDQDGDVAALMLGPDGHLRLLPLGPSPVWGYFGE